MTKSEFISPDLVPGSDGLARPPWAATDPLLQEYYDTEWGMPVKSEQGILERLCLESFQSGLSWLIVLRKRAALRTAFDNFVPDKVARYDEAAVARLLNNPAIIRNERKIRAVISNARATVALRSKGGLADFVWSFKPENNLAPRTLADIPSTTEESTALAKALKKEGFTFVGPTTMFALMAAIGMVDSHLLGSHRRGSSGVWESQKDASA